MDKRTRSALEASIKHWEENAGVTNSMQVKIGPGACALCKEFGYDAREQACTGCPVFENTGERFCNGSPYPAAYKAICAWDKDEDAGPAFREAALNEVNYLKSLLPKEA